MSFSDVPLFEKALDCKIVVFYRNKDSRKQQTLKKEMGKIPPYLIPLSSVQSILSTTTRDVVTAIQAHLAYTLGSVVPIFVNPEEREIGL